MRIIVGVLLMFSGTALGFVPLDPVVCRFNQSDPCYVALGHKLDLQMPPESNEFTYSSENTSAVIFKFKKGITTCSTDCSRWTFDINNRTIKMTSIESNDSGRYRLETFDARGKHLGLYYINLITEAAVSSVEVGDNCISAGERRVSCSSEGDQLHFSWTLSGSFQWKLADGNRTVLLDKNTDGNFTCHVKNHVSYGNYTVELQQCPGTSTAAPTTSMRTTLSGNGTSVTVNHTETHKPTSTSQSKFYMALFVLVSLAVLLVILFSIVCCVYKKKHAAKKTDSSHDAELMYAHITPRPANKSERTERPVGAQDESVEYATVISQPRQKKKMQKEEEVQYGEVVCNAPNRRKDVRQPKEEECLYSQVRHGR